MSQKPAGQQTPKALFYLTIALVVTSLTLMGSFARAVKKADDDQFWEFTAMFSEIYNEIQNKYVEEVDSKKLFEGALQGMFLTLDPHSQYMDPDNYSQLEKDTEGAFSGVGLHITIRDGVLTVIAPIPGSPAAKAGVRPWDRIVEIDGKKTEGITIIDAVKKLTGPAGTTVTIKVYREGEPDFLTFTLVRKNIKIESVYYKMLDDKVGYVRLAKFSDATSRDLRKAIEFFKEKNAKGMILDLRFNAGGLLKEAIDVSDLFLPKGKVIVSTKGRMKNQNQEFRSENDPITDLPMIVLVNKASASASEIVAGALKDHRRAMVVGVKGARTYGKGSVQTIEEISHSFEKDENGNYRPAAIRLTTAKYYTPSGVSIDKIGITPDIAVELPKGHEADLLRHGMFGDPPMDEEEVTTTPSKFTWKNSKLDDEKSSPTETKKSESEPTKEEEEGLDPPLEGSAVKSKSEETTTSEPRKIIPIDRTLFPTEEVEGEAKKKDEKKPKRNGEFVDYQLEAARRLMRAYLDEGKDFFDPQSGMPPQVASAPKSEETPTAAK
ncbi:MAG: S41 family peptidase [Candidatus Sumerlaeaceae bacterium]|nr:S41 family peptidase [Candidatus Sumerlaeaceae bacterium]